jgi:acyl-CoA thioesterase II
VTVSRIEHPSPPSGWRSADGATGHPCPYRARAWWGDTLVAQSSDCIRVEHAGRAPVLYFPCSEVRFGLFRAEDEPRTYPEGTARVFSLDSPAEPPTAQEAGSWRASPDRSLGGRDVLWSLTDPSPEYRWLSDHAAFDDDRVRVEVVDPMGSDATRDTTVKRFPTWGDALDLVDVLDVRPEGEGSFLSVALADERRPVVEGSQMLGQAIVAATRLAPGRRTVSAHMVFTRPADAHHPLRFELGEQSGGKTFATYSVEVEQGGRRRATGTLLLDVTSPDVIRHGAPPPDVPGPYESEPLDMGVTGRDIRVVDGAYTDDPDAPVGPPVLDAWVRFREVPEDPALHAALLAQFTGHLPIAAALRPHAGIGQREAHRTLSTAINAIAISLHREVRADRWMLYHHLSTFAGDGMTHAEGRVHGEGGELLASFAVDAMVRPFPESSAGPVDDRTAM